ncbi:MAG: hypothetical protein ACYC54_04715 [Sedimentisphaerales bacterium]
MHWTTRQLLKSLTKFAVETVKDGADFVTLGIPKEIFREKVAKAVAGRLKPCISSRPDDYRYWSLIRIGLSEQEVGENLGVPDEIIMSEEWENYTEQWYYKIKGGLHGKVWFRNKTVIAFRYPNTEKTKYIEELSQLHK